VSSYKSQDQAATEAETPGALVDQRLIKALGHPLRVRILSILNEKTSSPSALAEELSVGVHMTSHHVKVLNETGFIELVDEQPRRGATEHYYRGIHRALIPPDAWEQLPGNIQQNIAADTFRLIFTDANEALLSNAYSARPDSHVSWTPMILDEAGWNAFVDLLAKTLDEAFDIQAAVTARMAERKSPDDGVSVTMALAGFESTRGTEDGLKTSATKR
jgi:DNA-binding transcriptional ArsR family regulator